MRALVDLVVPPVCLTCRTPGADLCARCRRALPWLTAMPLCPRCGLPDPCGRRCPAAGQSFSAAWAPLAHDGPARTLVAALKFRRATAAADVLAALVVANAPAGLFDDASVVPVPADRGRRRARGLDHARVLSAAIARRAGRPHDPHLLRRTTEGARQLGAGRAERLAAGRHAVAVRGGAAGRMPARAVLVDDVHTTGATLDACAAALLQAGAGGVVACTAVRALR